MCFCVLNGVWLVFCLLMTKRVAMGNEDDKAANVIMIMIDDIGRADVGLYGSEWETPNLDSFIQSSITLSHHYIGYVCSASRSQFLTGRYSYHNGYGSLNVFDVEKMGAIPQNTPTIMEYLSKYGNYKTYGIGKWQLGNVIDAHLAPNRGFDKFIGYNSGMEDYFTKKNGDYLDFWNDLTVSDEYAGGYSTDQYFDEMINMMDSHLLHNPKDSFFMYVGLQANHIPYPDHDNDPDGTWTQYYDTCMDKYAEDIQAIRDRRYVCECMLGIDAGIGKLTSYFERESSLWEDTIIILTGDNGGDISGGSCNYPLRGGKNTFFEGGQRVLTFVGGGKINNKQRGKTLDGLISNVDWFPTILSFAKLIPQDSIHVRFDLEYDTRNMNDVNDISTVTMEIDGYNMHNYLFNSKNTDIGSDDYKPVRDHILFHLLPKLDNETNYFLNDGINNYNLDDMNEIAIIFYDNKRLWKYIDVTQSKNPIGDPVINGGWCEKITSSSGNGKDDFYIDYDENDDSQYYGLFDIDNDESERLNYFEDDNLLLLNKITTKQEINNLINEKISFYVNQDNNYKGSQNSQFLFGDFECFSVGGESIANVASSVAEENNAWVPFYDENEFEIAINEECNLDEYHPIFKLQTTAFEWPINVKVIDNSDVIKQLNSHVPDDTLQDKERDNNKNGFIVNQSHALQNGDGNQSQMYISIIVCLVLFVIFGFGAIISYHKWRSRFNTICSVGVLNDDDDYQPIGPV